MSRDRSTGHADKSRIRGRIPITPGWVYVDDGLGTHYCSACNCKVRDPVKVSHCCDAKTVEIPRPMAMRKNNEVQECPVIVDRVELFRWAKEATQRIRPFFLPRRNKPSWEP